MDLIMTVNVKKKADQFEGMFEDIVVDQVSGYGDFYELVDKERMGDDWMRLRYNYTLGDDEGYILTVDIQEENDDTSVVVTKKDELENTLNENKYDTVQEAVTKTSL